MEAGVSEERHRPVGVSEQDQSAVAVRVLASVGEVPTVGVAESSGGQCLTSYPTLR